MGSKDTNTAINVSYCVCEICLVEITRLVTDSFVNFALFMRLIEYVRRHI